MYTGGWQRISSPFEAGFSLPCANLWKSVPGVPAIREAIFLDFDGTLAPISPDPSSVRLSPRKISLLETLSSYFPVFIVSGRAFSEIDRLVPVRALAGLSGDHGAVRRFQGKVEIHPVAERSRASLERWIPRLVDFAGRIQGIRAEIKDFSFSVHYRGVAEEAVPEVFQGLYALFDSWSDKGLFQVVQGKMVWEIRPKGGVTKEETIDFFLSRLALLSSSPDDPAFLCRPVMIGDDTTDLLAVNHAIRLGGKGYWVGDRVPGLHDQAGLFSDPEGVWEFLESLLNEAKSGTGRSPGAGFRGG
jgi:trehalose-phosphatase